VDRENAPHDDEVLSGSDRSWVPLSMRRSRRTHRTQVRVSRPAGWLTGGIVVLATIVLQPGELLSSREQAPRENPSDPASGPGIVGDDSGVERVWTSGPVRSSVNTFVQTSTRLVRLPPS
jgi:hypothetical protein